MLARDAASATRLASAAVMLWRGHTATSSKIATAAIPARSTNPAQPTAPGLTRASTPAATARAISPAAAQRQAPADTPKGRLEKDRVASIGRNVQDLVNQSFPATSYWIGWEISTVCEAWKAPLC